MSLICNHGINLKYDRCKLCEDLAVEKSTVERFKVLEDYVIKLEARMTKMEKAIFRMKKDGYKK